MRQNKYQFVSVPEEWVRVNGRASVIVCDTGCDIQHPHIEGHIEEYVSFIPGNKEVVQSKHGTHVTGIIASIAPHARISIGQCLRHGRGALKRLEDALKWAYLKRPDVLNLSIAYPNNDKRIGMLLQEISNNGTIICASHADRPNLYPSSYPFVMSVAGFHSQHDGGCKIDVFSPSSIVSSVPGGTFDIMKGNSMACAYVSGVCCLAKAYDNSITMNDIILAIRKGVRDGKSNDCGYVLSHYSSSSSSSSSLTTKVSS